MPLKPHPTDPDKLVFTAGDYAAPTYFTSEHAMSMTLRDYFAGQAMQAFIIRGIISAEGLNKKQAITVMAYETADEMLRAKENDEIRHP